MDLQEFVEPDWNYGLTAFATRPVIESERKLFKKFQLWKQPSNRDSI